MALFRKKQETVTAKEMIGPPGKQPKSALLMIILVPVIAFSLIFGAILLSIYLPPSSFDPALEQVIREELRLPDGEKITRTELKTISYLNATGRGVQSLEGIQQLPQLRVIILRDNPITDLSPLKTLPVLTLVDVRDCPITDYSLLDDLDYVYK